MVNASMAYNFFNKQSAGTCTQKRKGINFENKQLAEELNRPVIKKFKECKIYFSFKYNYWDVDLRDMQLISK